MKKTNSYWWLGIVAGILSIFLGWFLLSNTAITTVALMQVLGLYWLLTGSIDIVDSMFSKVEEHRGWKLAGGILGILAGLVVLNSPILSTIMTSAFIVYVIAFTFMINGTIRVFLGRRVEGGKHHWSFGSLIVGAIYILLGFVILANTAISGAILLRTLGILAMTGGIVSIAAAFMFKGEAS